MRIAAYLITAFALGMAAVLAWQWLLPKIYYG